MSTSREKMQQARELIQAKRYDEARAVLRGINHEMALDWLDKIDKLDPPQVEKVKEPEKHTAWLPILFLLVIVVVILGIAFYLGVITPMSDHIQQTVNAIDNEALYCSTYCKAIDGGPECVDTCFKGTPTPH